MAGSRQKIENLVLFYEIYFLTLRAVQTLLLCCLQIGTPITIIFPYAQGQAQKAHTVGDSALLGESQ